ncbi:MAG: His/Gly/Thr/Pro-type tRNA ligase C-terminal domain-containing protein, partial [Anaerolineae bacterium]|nr:His/Gly/Thr/Pro-type tRNA ligase C-terminal domain-containing protein [Anaerolineae bacterium]
RLLACLAERHHDDQGLIWPLAAAPYALHLVALPGDDAVMAAAERLYVELRAAGVAVLYDDREESPGVKFTDADLIGLPLRLTVGQRGLQQGTVELKHRDRDERIAVPLVEAVARVRLEAGR